MYRISFEWFCRKCITATYTIFNKEHAGLICVNICKSCRNRRIFAEVIVRKDGQTDRQIEVINTFQLLWESVKNTV